MRRCFCPLLFVQHLNCSHLIWFINKFNSPPRRASCGASRLELEKKTSSIHPLRLRDWNNKDRREWKRNRDNISARLSSVSREIVWLDAILLPFRVKTGLRRLRFASAIKIQIWINQSEKSKLNGKWHAWRNFQMKSFRT